MNVFRGKCLSRIALVMALVFTLTSCASVPGKTRQEKGSIVGAAGGAVVGAVIGGFNNGFKGAVAGAIAGGAAGYVLGSLVGKYYDDRAKKLGELQKKTGIPIESGAYEVAKAPEAPKGKKAAAPSKADEKKLGRARTAFKAVVPAQFATGAAKLSPRARQFFETLAKAYKDDGVRRVLIVGHTDSTGSPSGNQRLSELRARAVGKVFLAAGYPASYIYYQGAGESEPVADNSTEEGRAKNRRVEVIDAESPRGLAIAKRASIAEARAAYAKAASGRKRKTMTTARAASRKRAAQAPAAPKRQPAAVARAVRGKGAILPFHGEPYHGQMLMAEGEKARSASETGHGLIDMLARAKQALAEPFTAHAAEPSAIPAFMDDELPAEGRIKRLDGKRSNVFEPDDHLPGYFGKPIYARLDGGAFVAIQPVSILKEHSLSESHPVVLAYRKLKGRNDKPDARLHGTARLYVNGKQMLYRWKASPRAARRYGILGLDVLLPEISDKEMAKPHARTLPAQFYYVRAGKAYVARAPMQVWLTPVKRASAGEVLRHAFLPGAI